MSAQGKVTLADIMAHLRTTATYQRAVQRYGFNRPLDLTDRYIIQRLVDVGRIVP